MRSQYVYSETMMSDPKRPRLSEEDFQAYLQLCHEMYLELRASGRWLWAEDSPNPEDLLESEDT